jgi:hypothetical protein
MLSVTYKPHMLSIIVLNVVILSVTYKPLMRSVIVLNVVMPSVVMLSVVAPFMVLVYESPTPFYKYTNIQLYISLPY